MSKKIASWASTRVSSVEMSFLVWPIELGGIGCPGIGIESEWPVAFCMGDGGDKWSRQ